MDNEELHAKLFPRLNEEELSALDSYGDVVELDAGDILFAEGVEQNKFCVVLAGEIKVVRQVRGQELVLAVHAPGEFTGEISMLGGGGAIATGRASIASRIRCIPLPQFRSIIASGTPLSIKILQAISTRRPVADSLVQQREKMISLGRISAGIAHELNNPAAATQRAASHLLDAFKEQQMLALDLVRSGASEVSVLKIKSLLKQFQDKPASGEKDPLEQSDREDQLVDWLENRSIEDSWKIAPVFAEGGLTVDDLERIQGESQKSCLSLCLHWLYSTINASNLVAEIEESTGRISGLVKAIKSYSYMDREGKQEVDVPRGLKDTLTILKHKLQNVEVVKEFEPDLPPIWGLGGELNQVWTNIIDNAADALEESNTLPKKLTIKARRANERMVLVEIVDNGPGIPDEIKKDVFDPFFTTKPVGSGTGLGLDSSFRIVVVDHRGDLKFQSKPGETRFQVYLPIGVNGNKEIDHAA